MTELQMPPDLPKKGDRIAGKYLVEEILGAGGMGVVVAARHMALRQRVAVKFLLPAAARMPEASARFLREARASVALQSEHVARVVDVGTLESGSPYMVMEYLAGTDFARLLKQRGALPVADAVDFVIQACEALGEAHHLGIVHRDLKPGNLFLTTRAEGSPLVKVLDFGLSKMAEEDVAESLTATTAVVGSPHYMSPEQIRSLKQVGPGTDLWALGVILHEMLTGRRPFEGRTLTAISASIVADVPPLVRSLRPDVPPGLDEVVLACLEKDVARRVSTVAELAARLAPFAPPRSAPELERIANLVTVGSRAMAIGAARSAGPAGTPVADDDDEATRAITTGEGESHPSAPFVAAHTAWLGDSALQSVSAPVAIGALATFPGASGPLLGPAGPLPVGQSRPVAMGERGPSFHPVSFPPSGGQSLPMPTPDLEADPGAWGQTQPQRRRVPTAAIVAAGAATVLVAALVGWLVLELYGGPSPSVASASVASPSLPSTVAVAIAAPEPPPAALPVPTLEPAPTPNAAASSVPRPSATSAAAAPPAPSPKPVATARPAAPPRRGGNPLDRAD